MWIPGVRNPIPFLMDVYVPPTNTPYICWFHQAFFVRVGAENATYFGLGTFQVSFYQKKLIF